MKSNTNDKIEQVEYFSKKYRYLTTFLVALPLILYLALGWI